MISHLKRAIVSAEMGISKIDQDIINMEGMSGTKTRHFYNNLLTMDDARYLEIGTWKGSSVCSAMCGNSASVLCIDNWSLFGGPKNEFMANFQKYKGKNIAGFLEQDCFSVDVGSLPKFNIYLFDGDHSVESQRKALTHYIDCLEDEFILVVDDWNWEDVRRGTMEGINELKLHIKWYHEIRLTDNNMHTPQPQASQTWWNGIFMAVMSKHSI